MAAVSTAIRRFRRGSGATISFADCRKYYGGGAEELTVYRVVMLNPNGGQCGQTAPTKDRNKAIGQLVTARKKHFATSDARFELQRGLPNPWGVDFENAAGRDYRWERVEA